MNRVSVIIPTLNEAQTIGDLIRYLVNNSALPEQLEIIVVDGGSTDNTIPIVNNVSSSIVEWSPKTINCAELNITLLHSEKGRAKQMNLGAKNASGNILYFLHADSFPPQNFDGFIINEIESGNQAGCFRMQFDSNHWWLRLASWLTQFSWRACRGGDQSQFILRKLFDDIGGFDERYIIYEDNILINELFKRKQFVVINKKIQTSSRLYKKHGVWKLQYHFWTIYVKKWFGASADDLFTYYKKHLG
ncbi:TIGR04283 family arsenosugar biosynthesis glycosyltransferase [Psychroserpens mesophilus]|uniref:TIGR04283 family arsenosugar biosynthesis glycosyltransferase n=1 Tax=Psychroserpens mesophilus TaxID=325473 RepID=UPI003D64D31D